MAWLAVLASIIIGFALSFNNRTVTGLIVSTLLLATLIFFIIRSFSSFREHRLRSSVSIMILGIVVLVVLVLFNARISTCEGLIGPDFRTNTLTDTCIIHRASGCDRSLPWYYAHGCDISDEERMEILEREGWLDRARAFCTRACDATDTALGSYSYCNRNEVRRTTGLDLACEDLVDCDIDCSAWLR